MCWSRSMVRQRTVITTAGDVLLLLPLVVWLGFELGIAPALGLSQAKHVRPIDRLALTADHLLYGLVLSATRPTPRS